MQNRRPLKNPEQNGKIWTRRAGEADEEDGFDENYFHRRPKSFCTEGGRVAVAGSAESVGTVMTADKAQKMSLADEYFIRNLIMVIHT